MSSNWGGRCTGSTSSSSDPVNGPSTSMDVSCPVYSSNNWSIGVSGSANASSDGVTPSVGVGLNIRF